MGFIDKVITPLAGPLTAAVNAVAQGGPRRQYKWNLKAAQEQQRMNQANFRMQNRENQRIQEEQRIYDSPTQQMARYKAAGLNPALIYGTSGSSGSAFPFQSAGIAPSRLDAPSASYGSPGTDILQGYQAAAQTQLTQQKTDESIQNTALKSALTDVAKTNPMLKPEVASWVAASMMETARLKAMESRFLLHINPGETISDTRFGKKINAQIEALEQKLKLNTSDLKIRNEILESKEFQNELLEIQRNWMKDGEITPQHIFQGLMLMISRWMIK